MKRNTNYICPGIEYVEMGISPVCADSGSVTETIGVSDMIDEGWKIEW